MLDPLSVALDEGVARQFAPLRIGVRAKRCGHLPHIDHGFVKGRKSHRFADVLGDALDRRRLDMWADVVEHDLIQRKMCIGQRLVGLRRRRMLAAEPCLREQTGIRQADQPAKRSTHPGQPGRVQSCDQRDHVACVLRHRIQRGIGQPVG